MSGGDGEVLARFAADHAKHNPEMVQQWKKRMPGEPPEVPVKRILAWCWRRIRALGRLAMRLVRRVRPNGRDTSDAAHD